MSTSWLTVSFIEVAAQSVNQLVEVKMPRILDDDCLDHLFHALANKTRRELLRQLSQGPSRVTELARPHGMSVNAISKHLFVLERAGLLRRDSKGHVQSCVLEASPLATADEWIRSYRRFWTSKLDRLADFMERPRKRKV